MTAGAINPEAFSYGYDRLRFIKPVFIGEVKGDGQFNVVWKTKGPVKAQPWSPFIAGNDKKKDEPEGK